MEELPNQSSSGQLRSCKRPAWRLIPLLWRYVLPYYPRRLCGAKLCSQCYVQLQLMVRYLGSSILYTHKDSYKAVAALFTVQFHNPEDMPIRPYYPHRL